MELENACCSPMDFPSQYMPLHNREFADANPRLGPPHGPPLLRA